MTGPIAQDALSPNLIAVGEEMHPRDVAADPLCEVFAVFKELPSSLAPLQPPFLGLVEGERIGRYPLRIFADLISGRHTRTFERSIPLAHIVSRFQHFNDTAVAVFGSPQQFVGVVTRRSLLETLLDQEGRVGSSNFGAQASSTALWPESLPGEDTTAGNLQRDVQRLAAEWILSENRERQHVAGDIHDRLRQLPVVAR